MRSRASINKTGDRPQFLQLPTPLFYKTEGRDLAKRQIAYHELFRNELGPGVIDVIRKSTTDNFALGVSRFAEQVKAKLGKSATPGKSV
jgi:hypothetical protein